MNSEFGEYLALLLKNHGYTQQGMIDWLLDHQRQPRRYQTAYALKEHLRVHRKALAHDHPMLLEIAHFFDSKREFAAASKIRHIYQQQAYDAGEFNGLHAGATVLSKGIDWMVFPDVDRSTSQHKKQDWLAALNGGDRSLLRESISFFYDYKDSYVHSYVRQLMAVDLALAAIGNAEYTEAYTIASICVYKWKQYVEQSALREYRPVLGDLFSYLTALQVKATAASHIYYFAPYSSSSRFFMDALLELRLSKRHFERSREVYDGLRITFYTRLLRTLCSSMMSLSQTGEDVKTVRDVSKKAKRCIGYLETLTVERGFWDGGRFIDEFLVRDTLSRARALTAETLEEVEYARTLTRELRNPGGSDMRGEDSMTKFRVAATKAICAISDFRVLSREPNEQARKALAEAGASIRSIIDTVEPPRQYHIRHIVELLVSYVRALKIASTQSASSEDQDDDGLSIFKERRKPAELERQLAKWDERARSLAGIMFEIDPNKGENIECLIQAHALRRREDALDVS